MQHVSRTSGKTLADQVDVCHLAATNVQAQTVANFYLAFDLELSIVPVLNKIDLPAAEPEKVAEQVQQVGEAF